MLQKHVSKGKSTQKTGPNAIQLNQVKPKPTFHTYRLSKSSFFSQYLHASTIYFSWLDLITIHFTTMMELYSQTSILAIIL